MRDLKSLIAAMPKAELHMHLEGSIEPDLMFRLAARNGIKLDYGSEAELQAAYDFTNLQSFLDVYYAGLTVLLTEQDFYDMTWDYMKRARADNVVHAELFISPQAHTRRGVPFAAMAAGINAALRDAARDFGITSGLIAGLQRQWSEEDAFAMLEEAQAHPDGFVGLGLGGPEVGNPPQKFARVFERARAIGWRTVAHAGEEGPAAYVADTVDVLKVDRIDHGVHCDQDPRLVERLAELQVPLTVCPISNVKLKVYPDLAAHNLKRLLRAGLRVTVNSDDPSYFLGYVNDNYLGCLEALDLSRDDLHALTKNSFTSAFISDAEKARYIGILDESFAH
ncbi:MAG: adenosine deaminase [Betaproteobacteria bacterium]|nr:adenosine deaminase [Betaproteobacteria bacterium]